MFAQRTLFVLTLICSLALAIPALAEGITVRAAETVRLDNTRLHQVIDPVLGSKPALSGELFIYRVDLGNEIYSINEAGEVSMNRGQGKLRALLKLRTSSRLSKVETIQVLGNTEEELLKKLAHELEILLRNY